MPRRDLADDASGLHRSPASTHAPTPRLRPAQVIGVVGSACVGLALLGACLALLVIAAAPWGPCDPAVSACGPARGRLVGAGFLSGVIGALTLGLLAGWLLRRARARVEPG